MKKKEMLKYILTIVMILTLFGGGTYFAVMKNMPESKKEIYKEKQKEKEKKEVIATPTDYMKLIETAKATEINAEMTKIDNITVHKTTIGGLKDKSFENKINNDIQTKLDEAIAFLKTLDSKFTKSVSVFISANFSHVVSISVNANAYYSGDREYESENKHFGLNYNLNTKSDLNYEDLFVSESAARLFYQSAAFEHLSKKYGYEENEVGLLNPAKNPDYSQVEEELLLLMRKYDAGNFQFNFSTSSINVFFEDLYLYQNISVQKHNVNILTKFMTNDKVYENDKKYKMVPLVDYEMDTEITFEQMNGVFVRYTKRQNDSKDILEYIRKITKDLKQKYPNKPVILDVDGSLSEKVLRSDAKLEELYFQGELYVGEKNMSDSDFYKLYLNNLQDNFSHIYSGDLRDMKTYATEYLETISYYNKVEIKSIKDLFKEDYDYQSVINQILRREVTASLDNLTFKFNIHGLQVYENKTLLEIINYNSFDVSQYK